MHNLLDSFIEDGRKHLSIINEAVRDDYYQYRESLHALKGTSTELGAVTLANLCRQAETLKPAQINSAEMIELVETLNHVFDDTLNTIREALAVAPYQTKH